MPTPRLSDELAKEAADAFIALGNKSQAAELLGLPRNTFCSRLKAAAERGMLGTKPVLPGFRIAQISNTPNGDYIKQRPEHGEEFELPAGHTIKGVSALVDADGRTIQQWVKTGADSRQQAEAFAAMVDALKEELPRVTIMPPPASVEADLLNQFVVTDSHFGMLAWREETGADYDLRIAEQLLLDWFSAAIATAPQAHTAVLAQLGDLMHHDALESVTPAHKHVLDADSRLQKVIRVVIRTVRRIIDMLLQKHQHVHVVMASGNHDPASSAWLREMLAAMYEDEPRISVDNSPMLYYAYEWGGTALFYHHGHKSNIKTLDVKCAGIFRELFGRSKFAYCHHGHLHSDEGVKTDLMYVERHETLAAPDAYAAGGPWLSGRSAKRITYSKLFGEVSRNTMRPEMVAGAYVAANDNEPAEQRRVA
ncbi:helix-turn-helix domain-containing protein [Rhizobium binae]|uniref:helix-turn-helix domain-containing protein n=1 Tax=Rhizobium binae TaxID=1138190 RepID=UPI001C82F2CF|nr:helix-turn-helix domain-containing protein [Rhizobium binae]MBX4941196.1 oxidoreductase [Rhizobium binae]